MYIFFPKTLQKKNHYFELNITIISILYLCTYFIMGQKIGAFFLGTQFLVPADA